MGARIPALCFGTLVSAAALAAQQPQPAPRQPQTFRSGVVLIPLDVRVVDRHGKPITGLKQEDFTVIEDGVAQKIVHFSFNVLTPMKGETADAPLDFRKPLGDTIAPQNRRIFLFVLGSGRQVGPVKGVEAAMKFVKERLLPQDQVAIIAFNRATDFTTDHARVVETLQRYWDKHEWIESRLRHHFSGLAAVHASREIPPSIQKEVDAIFRVPGAVPSRSLTATGVTDARRIEEDNRRTRDRIMQAEIAAERLANNAAMPADATAVADAALDDISFDEFVEKVSDTQHDLGRLYAGIRYLRYLDGEKHLVFFTPNGLFLPRLENSNSIAALANDARVTVDIIHTYGVDAGPPPRAIMLEGGGRGGLRAAALAGVYFRQSFAVGSSKQISDLTGGTTTAFSSGAAAFTRLDEMTRAQYLLGYSPTNGNWNGGYRRITVRVNRKDARVLYRHGYSARRELTPLTRQQYLTYSRLAAAADAPREIDDLKFAVGDVTKQSADGGQVLSVTVRLSPGAVKLVAKDGHHVGKVEALYFCADKKQQMVGELSHTVDFTLTDEQNERFQRQGAGFTVRVPVRGEPHYFKAILYDYAADLVGSVMRDLTKK